MVFKPTLENIKLNPIQKTLRPQGIHDDLCRKSEDTSSERTIINTPTTVENKINFH
jgi:hypothetical protein